MSLDLKSGLQPIVQPVPEFSEKGKRQNGALFIRFSLF